MMVSYIPFLTLVVLALSQPSAYPPQDVIPSGFPSGAPSMDCQTLRIARGDKDESALLEMQETEVNHNQWWSNDEEQISVFYDGARWNVRSDASILKSDQTASTTPPSGTYVFMSFEENNLEEVPTWEFTFSCDFFDVEDSFSEDSFSEDSFSEDSFSEDSFSEDDFSFLPTPLPTSSFFQPTPTATTTFAPTPATPVPTPSPSVLTSEPTSVPVLVKARLELKVTRQEFQAEKENYVEDFAISAGVDKRAVTMYLLGEVPTYRAQQQRRELRGGLQVICDILTDAPEEVEETVGSFGFVQEFNEQFHAVVLGRVVETVVVTQAPTPQPTAASDSVNTSVAGSTGEEMTSRALIIIAVLVASCFICGVYMVCGRSSSKAVVLKGPSLASVLPESSISVYYDEEAEGTAGATSKRFPYTKDGTPNWPRELYQEITREGEGTTGKDVESVL